MLQLIQVVLPVFMVIGAGYICVRLDYFSDEAIDGLTRFSQAFAIPCLLFRATLNLDIGAVFDPGLLAAFYIGNTATFFLGLIGARTLFRRRPGESVAIGFGALFSNSVILGLPIIERAFGGDALSAAYIIVALHAPYCYLLGITVMEISRADGRGARETARAVANALFRNALMIGIALGFAANFAGVTLPGPVSAGLDLVVAGALPAALFGLGGVLTRYRIRASVGEAMMIAFLSLVIHPTITFTLAHYVLDLPVPFVRGAVLTAAMAPGVNSYIFARMYQRAEDSAASTVLLATGISVFSVSVWLAILHAI